MPEMPSKEAWVSLRWQRRHNQHGWGPWRKRAAWIPHRLRSKKSALNFFDWNCVTCIFDPSFFISWDYFGDGTFVCGILARALFIYIYILRCIYIYIFLFLGKFFSNGDVRSRDDVSFVCLVLFCFARLWWMSTVFGCGKISCDSACWWNFIFPLPKKKLKAASSRTPSSVCVRSPRPPALCIWVVVILW